MRRCWRVNLFLGINILEGYSMRSHLTTHPAFQAPLDYGQFAKGGVWEEAWQFKSSQIPDEDTVISYLQDATEVAFELFFGPAFFGLRFRGTPAEVRHGAISCVKAYQMCSAETTFFKLLSNSLKTQPWGQTIAFAEVGAVNFWKSVGPFRLPMLDNAKNNPESVMQALMQTNVGRNTEHPRALELGCDAHYPHWFGMPISSQTPPYALSPELLFNALSCI
jgi:hypothetical protein